ncbi:DMT family transporter [Paenibacillus sp. SC116]|uniref:DMT family transporter n=1 Tax=Paenibacillus sp. SC116 TaxID=2968986 RepID=UPI00215A7009|nr:DMT family transporter [Paenibacillus sp. SC116]MCR8845109.1 DMT family transporter [Paenibacillus sp. SC116]
MSSVIVLLIVLIGGVATAFQAGVNGLLGKKIGIIEGSFVSFLTGTIVLLILLLITSRGHLGPLVQALHVPKWQLTGGILGVIYVLIMIFAVPKIGTATTFVAIIAAQMLMSTVIDHYGLFGKTVPINSYKVIGLMLLASALFFIYKSSQVQG